MRLKNLGELNKLYDFKDTRILCEIFEQRSAHLQKMFKFNPKNVILPVLLAFVFIEVKVNVWLLFLLTLNRLNFLRETFSFIGHLFIAGIVYLLDSFIYCRKFHDKNSKIMFFYEIYTPIFEKK